MRWSWLGNGITIAQDGFKNLADIWINFKQTMLALYLFWDTWLPQWLDPKKLLWDGFFTVHPGWGSPLPGNSSNSCYDNPMVWPLKVVWNPWLVRGNWSYKMSLGSLRSFGMPLGVPSMSGNWISEKIKADRIRSVHEPLVHLMVSSVLSIPLIVNGVHHRLLCLI